MLKHIFIVLLRLPDEHRGWCKSEYCIILLCPNQRKFGRGAQSECLAHKILITSRRQSNFNCSSFQTRQYAVLIHDRANAISVLIFFTWLMDLIEDEHLRRDREASGLSALDRKYHSCCSYLYLIFSYYVYIQSLNYYLQYQSLTWSWYHRITALLIHKLVVSIEISM